MSAAGDTGPGVWATSWNWNGVAAAWATASQTESSL